MFRFITSCLSREIKKKFIFISFLLISLFAISLPTYAEESAAIPLGKPTLFKNLVSMVNDSQGNIYVTDYDPVTRSLPQLIHKISSSGTYLGSINLDINVFALTIDKANNLYVYTGTHIAKIKTSGKIIKKWKIDSVLKPTGLAVDSKNNIYLTLPTEIKVYNAEGILIKRITNITGQFSAQGFFDARIIAINDNDQLLIKDLTYIYQIDTNGKSLNPRLDVRNLFNNDSDTAIAYNNLNQIYFSSHQCACVKIFSGDGTFIKNLAYYTSLKNHNLNILLSKKSNNLTITDYSLSSIKSINYDSVTQWSLGDESDRLGQVSGLAIDSMKNIYLLDNTYHRVSKFSPQGISLKIWGSSGESGGLFGNFQRVTIDSSDNLYIQDYDSDTYTRTTQVFSSDGIFLEKYLSPWRNFDKQGNNYQLLSKDDHYYIQKYDRNKNLLKEIDVGKLLPSKPIFTTYSYVNDSFLIDSNGDIIIGRHSSYRYNSSDYFLTLFKINFNTGKTIKTVDFAPTVPLLGVDNNDSLYSDYLEVLDKDLNYLGYYHQLYTPFLSLALDKKYNSINLLYNNYDGIAGYSLKTLKPFAKTTAPILKSITKKGTQGEVILKWQDRSTDETGFNIYRSVSPGGFQLIMTTAANTNKVRLAAPVDFTEGSSYSYFVTAVKNSEESLMSGKLSVNF